MFSLTNPMHPGQFLKEAYMEPLELTITALSKKLNMSTSAVSRLINGKSDLSYEMAILLSQNIGRSPESWMNIQTAYGLAKAKASLSV